MPAEDLRKQLERDAKRRLEEHLDQLRLEFERMRLESHRKWEEFLMKLDFPLPELIPPGAIPEPPPQVAAADLADLRGAFRSIDAAENQVDALKAFLSACVRHSGRAVLLVSRGDTLAVWKAEGFSPGEEASLRSVSVSAGSHPAIASAMDGAPVAVTPAAPLAGILSISAGERALLCPVVVREKISALLYADQKTAGAAFDPEALALLCFLIGAAVDRLSSRKIRPAPALKPIERFETEAAASRIALATEPATEPEPEPESEPEPEPEIAPEAARGMEPPDALEVEEAAEEPEPEPPPPAPERPARGIDFDTTGHPYRPPPGVMPAGPRILRGPLAAIEEDPHEHARKIARLLVSDIRLYNEAAIEEGKRHNDIYVRLKDDIDRARQTYNDRVPESVRSSTNYFHEELIRALADGSSDALGS